MAPIPTILVSLARPQPHLLLAARHGDNINNDNSNDDQFWGALMAEHEQEPTAFMCIAFSLVMLLVLGLLYYTGRHWDQCNSDTSFRRRICQRCRDDAGAQAAKLRHCAGSSPRLPTDTKLSEKQGEKQGESPPTWHGSNMLNTSWGWMG